MGIDMINIYCCEDNEMERKELKSVIEEGIRTEGMEFCLVTTTASPYELLEIAANDTESCVFFLDVELGVDMNGLSLAQKLRERFPRCYIIFTTSHSEMSYMTFTYKVEAMDFIIKGDTNFIFLSNKGFAVIFNNRFRSVAPILHQPIHLSSKRFSIIKQN